MTLNKFWRILSTYFSVILLILIIVAPFYWIFSSSVKTNQEIISRNITFFPHSFTLKHFTDLFAASNYPRYLLNSTLVATLTMAFTVILATMAAYSIYRLRFPGRNLISKLLLSAYAFPSILLLIPLYLMLSSVRPKIIDTPWALIIVNVTFAAPFGVWMLQAFFRSVPIELEDAAYLDGASHLQTMFRIVLPLTTPGISSIAIYSFISSWTEYMFASVLISGEASRTIPVGLAGIVGQYQVDWGLLLAGATIATLPVLFLFSLVGRNFVEGLTAGAIK